MMLEFLTTLVLGAAGFCFKPQGPFNRGRRLGAAPRRVLEVPLSSSARIAQTEAWLQKWWASYEVSQEMAMPLRGRWTDDKVLELRFVAVPSDGLDCSVLRPGVDSPFGALSVSEVAAEGRKEQAAALAQAAVDRLVRQLERDADLCGFSVQDFEERDLDDERAFTTTSTKEDDAPRKKMDPQLYAGPYNEKVKQSAVDLFEAAAFEAGEMPPHGDVRDFKPRVDAAEASKLRDLFERGEALARAASAEKEAADEVGQAQFEVSLEGTGLRGGVDLFAGPPPVAAEEEAIIDKARRRRQEETTTRRKGGTRTYVREEPPRVVPANAEMRARFEVLLREIINNPDPATRDLILDAYRDVLLDASFATLAREAMARDENDPHKVGEALEILNAKVIDLATQLAEMAAFVEQQHLETIRLVCDAAKEDSNERPLSLALRDLRLRFDRDFIAYLAYAVNDESLSRGGGRSTDGKERSVEWRLVLNAVKDVVYSFLAKERMADLDAIYTVLNLKDPRVRRKTLELQVKNMSNESLEYYLDTAKNIFDNLLFADPDETTVKRPDVNVASRLRELRGWLVELLEEYHEPRHLRFLTGEEELGMSRLPLPDSEVVTQDAGTVLSDLGFDDDDDDDFDGDDDDEYAPLDADDEDEDYHSP